MCFQANSWKLLCEKFKYCYDEADDTVYVLAFEDGLSSVYRASKVAVGAECVAFCEVKSILPRKNSFMEFLTFQLG